MNALVLKSVAQEVWRRSRGHSMVSLHKKIPPDLLARLEQAAIEMDMDSSDLLRALLETQLPGSREVSS